MLNSFQHPVTLKTYKNQRRWIPKQVRNDPFSRLFLRMLKCYNYFTRNTMSADYRIGQGFDAHRFKEGRKLILGGVDIPFPWGLDGHSDADALCHAVADALLGAAALGDIGRHFPPSDAQWKDANSLLLLEKVENLIWKAHYKVVNVDAAIICEEPKISLYSKQMRENLAKVLKIDSENIGIKGKTTEQMGFTGRREGIAVIAVALLKKI